MSKNIDERVVSMRFDNAQFERETRTTMSTLDKLKEKLHFGSAAKGLDDLNSSVRRVDFNPLAKGVEAIGVKFSALQVMAVTALSNITTAAMNAGKRIVSALTIDPIKTGLQEYETKINAVQVIKANTMGKNTMEEITAALEELNTYADKTIYNFAQMTSNVGKFVAQGLDVKQATNAIQGMANLAAASGASAEDMSRATYQMSQALGGTIRKIDWNSLRNANMATTTLKETLMDIARVEGIDIDAMIKNKGVFEDTLEEGWLSGELFTKAMNIYSGVYSDAELAAQGFNDEQIKKFQEIAKTASEAATQVKTVSQLWDVLKETAQSGWTQTWEHIIGDFDTAKEDLSKAQVYFSGIIDGMSQARNELFSGWNKAGGRDMLIDSLVNVWKAVESVVVPIKDAFRDIFAPETVGQGVEWLLKFTEGLKNLTAKLKLSSGTSESLKNTFKGLFAVLDIGWKIIKSLFIAVKPLFGVFADLGGGILGATGSLGEWLVTLNDFLDKTGIFTNFAEGIAIVLKKVIGYVKTYFTPFVVAIQNGMSRILGGANNMKDGVVDAIDSMGQSITGSKVFEILQSMGKLFYTIGSAIAKFFGNALRNIVNVLGNADFSGFFDLLNTISLGGIAVGIGKFAKSFISITESLDDFGDKIGGILDSVKGCFEAWQGSIKSDIILKIASAIGILAVSLLILAGIDSAKLTVSLGAISALFVELLGSMKLMTGFGLSVDLAKASTMTLAFAGAILMLAAALRMIGNLDIDNMIAAGGVISGLMWSMLGVSKILGKTDKTAITGTKQMMGYAIAMVILAAAVKMIGDLDIDNMVAATVAILALMGSMVAVSKILGNPKNANNVLNGMGQMVLFAGAILTLAAALRMIGSMEVAELAHGLITVALLMGAMVGAAVLLSKYAANITMVGIGLIAVALAVDLLAIAISKLGGMEVSELAHGLVAVGVVLVALIGFAHSVKTASKDLIWASVSFIPIATAMIILAKACDMFCDIDWETLGKAGSVFGGLVAGVILLRFATSAAIQGAAALAIVAASLIPIVGALMLFEDIDWETIGKAGVVVGGLIVILGILGGLGVALGGTFTAALLATGGAVALLGLGVLEIGLGFAVLTFALSGLAIAISAVADASYYFVENIFKILQLISDKAIMFGPSMAKSIANGISMMAQAVALSAGDVADAFVAVIFAIGDALIEVVPGLVEILSEIALLSLEALVEYIPRWADALIDLFIALIDTLADRAPDLYLSIQNFLMALVQILVDIGESFDPDFESLKAITVGLGIVIGIMGVLASIAPLATTAMVGVLALSALIGEIILVLMGFGLIAQLDFVINLISDAGYLFEEIGIAIGSFIGGILGGIASGATSQLPEIGSNLSKFMKSAKSFFEGVKGLDSTTLDSIKSLAGAVVALGAASVVDAVTNWITGDSSLVTFGKEIAEFGPYFKSFHDSIKGVDGEVVVNAANAAKAISEMATNLPNQGGLVSWITGDNSLSKFAKELALFGPSLKSYASSVTGLDTNVVLNSVNAAKAISEMATNLPNQGGLVSWITGDNSLSKFAGELMLFGPSIKAYADSVAGMDSNVVVSSANAAKALAEMANIIPKIGGLQMLWEGENLLSVFGAQLPSFGAYMKMYADSVRGVDAEVVRKSALAARTLAELAASVASSNYSDLTSFGIAIAKFGSDFDKYLNTISSLRVTKVETANAALREVLDIVSIINSTSSASISSFGDSLSSFAASAMDDFVNAFTTAKPRVSNAAAELIQSFVAGLDKSFEIVISTFDSLFTNILATANGQYDSFYSAGAYVVEGFADGITDKTWMAEAKATAMAEAALAAARAALDEHSPSREFYKIGSFAGEGFVNAFSDYEPISYRAGSSIAESAKKGLSNAISRISGFINSDMDMQPTIRPVLDLSDVQSGVGAMNGMFGLNPSVDVLAEVGSINSMMNRRNQNGTNADVVSAINKLRGDVANNPGTTYNINGVSYNKGTDVADAIETLVRAVTIEGRA